MDVKGAFKDYCNKHRMRYTRERDLIIGEISHMKGHFDVDGLFLHIRNKYPEVKLAKGSVYRNIPHLLNVGLIRESLSENTHVCYEKSLGIIPHGHLKCFKCGKIVEFTDSRVEEINRAVCNRSGFKIKTVFYVISGYCRECQEKQVLGEGDNLRSG